MMISRRLRWNMAFFMMFLIVMLPFYTSEVMAEDVSDECVKAAEESSSNLGDLDEIIDRLVQVATVLYNFCSVMSVLNSVFSIFDTFFAIHPPSEGNPADEAKTCCLLAWTPFAGEFFEGLCRIYGKIYSFWSDNIYIYFQELCCFVMCSWCSGQKCGFEDLVPGVKKIWNKMSGIGASMSPYDNIYYSIACLCIVGIVVNLGRLKAIYQTHDCCLKASCEGEVSKQYCDMVLDYSICMYFEGAIPLALVGIVMSVVSTAVGKYLAGLIAKKFFWSCLVLNVYEIYKMPQTIENLQSVWEQLEQSVQDQDCDMLLEQAGITE
ncbi:hypothetical protein GF351_00820 [Candidatus Woesearchaeota archaeon]|nr:hypothetical protein [Candidatus Woesearchaeota archaeon]